MNFDFMPNILRNFWDETNNLVKTYPAVELVKIPMAEIQPSQFYVDEIKKQAVSDFVHTEEDLIIPLVNWEGHNVSVDGHTRLFVAAEKGIQNVYGFYTEAGDYVRDFAAEAIKRNIVSPYQLIEVKHEDYEKLWFAFCDEYFFKQISKKNGIFPFARRGAAFCCISKNYFSVPSSTCW